MDEAQIVSKTVDFIKGKLTGEGSGHDWWHIQRVWQIAKHVASKEKANMIVVELAALLHDIADWKFNEGDDKAGGRAAHEWLESLGVDKEIIDHVVKIVDGISFKGAGVEDKLVTIEGKVVQDADRLDAIGAMGIGRTFTYGGHKGREMYNPDTKVLMAKNFEEYKKAGQTTINHFYEKLLLLKDRMNTETGKEMAEGRHKFMEQFLDEFFAGAEEFFQFGFARNYVSYTTREKVFYLIHVFILSP